MVRSLLLRFMTVVLEKICGNLKILSLDIGRNSLQYPMPKVMENGFLLPISMEISILLFLSTECINLQTMGLPGKYFPFQKPDRIFRQWLFVRIVQSISAHTLASIPRLIREQPGKLLITQLEPL